MKIVIKRFNLDHVLANDKILYNTNNHYSKENREQPKDYREVLNQSNTSNWIDKFHDKKYYKFTLDKSDLIWMKQAYKIGSITGSFSKLFEEELETTCQKYNIPKGEWFVRTDKVSLKYGMHGIGPYDNLRDIFKSIVSTTYGHGCFNEEDNECNIYLMPWKEMMRDKEFRIFVYQNNITAISVQHLYSVNKWLNSLTDKEIGNNVHKILKYFDSNIRDKMKYMGNYVMDLSLVGENEQPYFIEPNSFGKDYAAGSALFHWIIDKEILYNHDVIEFRYVNE